MVTTEITSFDRDMIASGDGCALERSCEHSCFELVFAESHDLGDGKNDSFHIDACAGPQLGVTHGFVIEEQVGRAVGVATGNTGVSFAYGDDPAMWQTKGTEHYRIGNSTCTCSSTDRESHSPKLMPLDRECGAGLWSEVLAGIVGPPTVRWGLRYRLRCGH